MPLLGKNPWAEKGKRAGQRPIPFLTPVDFETAQAGVDQPMNGCQRSHLSGSPGGHPTHPPMTSSALTNPSQNAIFGKVLTEEETRSKVHKFLVLFLVFFPFRFLFFALVFFSSLLFVSCHFFLLFALPREKG